LHPVWSIVEAHADELDRLYRQQTGVQCDVVEGEEGPALAVTVVLAEPGSAIRVLLERKVVRYFVVRKGEQFTADPHTDCVDHGVYLLLAELATHC
jgi:hypothetical protein